MELQTLSTSTRLRANIDGLTLEATLTQDANNSRIEGGNIAKTESGSHVGSFSRYGDVVNYNITVTDRGERLQVISLIDDFIEELYGKAE